MRSVRRNPSAILLLLLALGEMAAADGYTTQFDNVDVDEVLANDRLLKKYLDCLTGDGTCTPEGKALKDILPEVMETQCGKCSEKQKARGEKLVRHLVSKRPDDWARLEKIYDPEGKYRAMVQAES